MSVFALPPGAAACGGRDRGGARVPGTRPRPRLCFVAQPRPSSPPVCVLAYSCPTASEHFFVSYFKSILKCGKGEKKPRGGSVTASRLDVLGSSRFSESFRSPGLHAVSGTRFVCGVLEFVRLRDHLLVFLECVMDTCLMSVSQRGGFRSCRTMTESLASHYYKEISTFALDFGFHFLR